MLSVTPGPSNIAYQKKRLRPQSPNSDVSDAQRVRGKAMPSLIEILAKPQAKTKNRIATPQDKAKNRKTEMLN